MARETAVYGPETGYAAHGPHVDLWGTLAWTPLRRWTQDRDDSPVNLLAQATRDGFHAELLRPEREIDLGRTVLLVAKEEYPQLSVERCLARLDHLCERVKDRLDEESAPPVVLNELISVLYEREGLKGNQEAYYDPRNSFLNDVLDRRLGIPLTLGIVALEVGWRLGLPLEGVSFPMHFLVRFSGSEVRLLIDPFDGGRIVFEDQAQELLDRAFGGTVRLQPSFLRAATKRDMIFRLLTNLKSLYVNTSDHARALSVVERMLMVRPGSTEDLRDRGVLLAHLGRASEAREQLEAYIGQAPYAEDVAEMRTLLRDLGERSGSGDGAGAHGPEDGDDGDDG